MNVFPFDSMAEDIVTRIFRILTFARCPYTAKRSEKQAAYRRLRKRCLGPHAAEVNSLRSILAAHGCQESWLDGTETIHLDVTPPRLTAIARYANAWGLLLSYGDLWKLHEASKLLNISSELIWMARQYPIAVRGKQDQPKVAFPEGAADWCTLFGWYAYGKMHPHCKLKQPALQRMCAQIRGRNASAEEMNQIEKLAESGGQPLILSPFVVPRRAGQ